MDTCRAGLSKSRRRAGLIVGLAFLAATAGLVLSSGSHGRRAKTQTFGQDRLVSWEPLPERDGEMCQWVPASTPMSLAAALRQTQGPNGAGLAPDSPVPSEGARAEVAKRKPIRVIRDPHSAYAGIALDPLRNEVVLADENQYSFLVYDRLENTPPKARMSEPKRMIRGEQTFIEYACGVYIDPANGDIYGVNNDTMHWLVVFNRDAKGDVPPTRKLATPHGTFGIAADEQENEMFVTIQDYQAVVVFKKTAQEQEDALRTLQGPRTLLADPHGIALDPKTGLIFVSNWGSNSERVVPPGGGPEKPNWPIGGGHLGVDYNIPSSGKFSPPSITVYRKGAKGNTPPFRMIQGPKTQMNWPTAVAVDPDRGELFVANDTGDSVVVFRTDASGDAAPIRVLRGPRTRIKNPTGVTVDLTNHELWVANFGSHSATVFKIDADGNVPPLRVIRSGPPNEPSPMIGNPHTIAFDTKRDEILVSN